MYPYQLAPANQYHYDYHYFYRQQQNIANRIFNLFRQEHSDIIRELEANGLDNEMINYILWTVIQYTLTHANQHSGTITNRTNDIYESMQNQVPWLTYLFRAYRLSTNQMRRILRTVIRFTLQNLSTSF
ncbi:hypothetical protein ACNQFZ_18260 [Schinkia sp. CFF1]